MSSQEPCPDKLERLLEEYSLKLDHFESKYNPFFKEVGVQLKEKVDHLRERIERYAKYHGNHQLKHLIESKSAKDEIDAVHMEVETLKSKMKEMDRLHKLNENIS
ncbi:MAG: hypothetical protein S4CHLAM7_12870 [Chlamydiae bacterium]|nr:hypothetical protein [Chlamydiota bacterium]